MLTFIFGCNNHLLGFRVAMQVWMVSMAKLSVFIERCGVPMEGWGMLMERRRVFMEVEIVLELLNLNRVASHRKVDERSFRSLCIVRNGSAHERCSLSGFLAKTPRKSSGRYSGRSDGAIYSQAPGQRSSICRCTCMKQAMWAGRWATRISAG